MASHPLHESGSGTSRAARNRAAAAPTSTSKTFVVMGKTFDPSKPDDYVQSFSIKRS
jgi:nitrate/nitrite transport system substrate-binding protein